MTTLIKVKLKKLDDQTNIVKYRVAANITEYHIKINLNVKMSIMNMFKMDVQTF